MQLDPEDTLDSQSANPKPYHSLDKGEQSDSRGQGELTHRGLHVDIYAPTYQDDQVDLMAIVPNDNQSAGRLDQIHGSNEVNSLHEEMEGRDRKEETTWEITHSEIKALPGKQKINTHHKSAFCKKHIWRHQKLKFLISTISTQYNVWAASAVGRKWGVAILVHKKLKVINSGAEIDGRVEWILIQMDEQILSVASVYAPNEAGDKMTFWRSLQQSLPPGQWLIGGDWNSVTSSLNTSSTSNIQPDEEDLLFQQLCATLQIRDARDLAGTRESLRFSRSQNRKGHFIWSRLDRV
ncbi:hypothetical protein R1sor_027570 [Riccia sorocarpa]|uniref:Endonuclease/exonuclease/phosphatase domain-containing protein n=1 Tax=Riccia sorocarpa TaxID=122646 RepID=A0ABD3GGC2_9MARC